MIYIFVRWFCWRLCCGQVSTRTATHSSDVKTQEFSSGVCEQRGGCMVWFCLYLCRFLFHIFFVVTRHVCQHRGWKFEPRFTQGLLNWRLHDLCCGGGRWGWETRKSLEGLATHHGSPKGPMTRPINGRCWIGIGGTLKEMCGGRSSRGFLLWSGHLWGWCW